MNYFEFLKKVGEKQIKPVYLFYGKERYLLSSALDKLVLAAIGKEKNDFDYVVLGEKDAVAENIVSLADTIPCFAPYRVIIVYNEYFFSSQTRKKENGNSVENEEKILSEYLDNPNPTSVVIFIAGENIDKRKKIIKNIQNIGEIIEFVPISGEMLVEWVLVKARELGFQLNRSSAAYLIKQCGNNLQKLNNELQKLYLYSGGSQLSVNEIDKIITPVLEVSIFHLVDAVAGKKTIEVLNILHQILQQGEPPAIVLTMVARQFRLLLEVKKLQQAGYNFKSIAEKLKQKNPYIIEKLSRYAAAFSEKKLNYAWKFLREADYQTKTGYLDPQTALEILFLRLEEI